MTSQSYLFVNLVLDDHLTIIIDSIFNLVIGCVGCEADDEHFTMPEITSRVSLICGTSTCHMIVSLQSGLLRNSSIVDIYFLSHDYMSSALFIREEFYS